MPNLPRKLDSTRQRWKVICDAIAEDILLDEEPPAIPDDAVSRMRERLAGLTKTVLADSLRPSAAVTGVVGGVEPKREGTKSAPLRLSDLVDDYCTNCRRITTHSIVSLVQDNAAKVPVKAEKVRCQTCYCDHYYSHEQPPHTKKSDSKMLKKDSQSHKK